MWSFIWSPHIFRVDTKHYTHPPFLFRALCQLIISRTTYFLILSLTILFPVDFSWATNPSDNLFNIAHQHVITYPVAVHRCYSQPSIVCINTKSITDVSLACGTCPLLGHLPHTCLPDRCCSLSGELHLCSIQAAGLLGTSHEWREGNTLIIWPQGFLYIDHRISLNSSCQ